MVLLDQINAKFRSYDGCLTLVSYKPKSSKMVYRLSSCDEEGVLNQTTGKPDIVMYYNQTKGGVDTFDQMCSGMSCSRKTNRWPMAMFYGILNMAFVNSYVIYCHNIVSRQEKPLNRRKFMKLLSTQLTSPWTTQRLTVSTLPRNLRDKIATSLCLLLKFVQKVQITLLPEKKNATVDIAHQNSEECQR